MEKFINLCAVAAPLPIDNLDTDQLMPKQFLRGIDKSGLAKGLLYNLRFRADGTKDEEFILNRPGFEEARIILGGSNFGCGSSREHAVWGLQQYGIRCVIATGFGEIFYSNCFNNGILAAKVSLGTANALFGILSTEKPVRLEVDVEKRAIRIADDSASPLWTFMLGERHRNMLLAGTDMLETTLKDMPKIERFRAKHEAAFPWMARLPGRMRRMFD